VRSGRKNSVEYYRSSYCTGSFLNIIAIHHDRYEESSLIAWQVMDEVRSRVVRLTSVPRGDPLGVAETPGVASLPFREMTSLPAFLFPLAGLARSLMDVPLDVRGSTSFTRPSFVAASETLPIPTSLTSCIHTNLLFTLHIRPPFTAKPWIPSQRCVIA
jgi:hypothetical protein